MLVVNADLPCAKARDLLTLLGALPEGGIALVEAADGTTNALALAAPHLFAPLYGPGSADAVPCAGRAAGGPVGDRTHPEPRRRRRHAGGSRAARRHGSGLTRARCLAELRAGLTRVKVAVLAGGVGGARFALALIESLGPAAITVVGNVGDDLEVLGLHVSPDLDTILYTLAGLLDDRARLGTRRRDLERTRSGRASSAARRGSSSATATSGSTSRGREALRRGEPLSAVTARFTQALGVEAAVLPATDDRLRTWVATPAGEFSFQEWFVAAAAP